MSSIWFDSNIIIAAVGLREIIVACLNLFRSMIQRFYFTIIVTFPTIFLMIFITIFLYSSWFHQWSWWTKTNGSWILHLIPRLSSLSLSSSLPTYQTTTFTFILAVCDLNNHFHFKTHCSLLQQSLSFYPCCPQLNPFSL